MSDTSQGPGWWLASDGKWYPPETAPGYVPPATAAPPPPTSETAPAMQRPWWKKKRFLIPIGVLILLIAISAASGGSNNAKSKLASTEATTTSAAPTTTAALSADLPNPTLTPGSVFATATPAVICVSGYTATVRDVPDSERQAVFASYGINYAQHDNYELDHLVPLELGGDNTQPNLWPESHAGSESSSVKDQLENKVHDLVCAGQVPLPEAQQAFEGDWVAADAKYMAVGVVTTSTTATPTTSVPPTTAAPVTTAASPPTTSSGVYYANCTAARAAGAAPLYRGQPGYRSALDRDGDGIACE